VKDDEFAFLNQKWVEKLGGFMKTLGVFGGMMGLMLFWATPICQAQQEASDADLRKLQETLVGNSGYTGRLRSVPISRVRTILEQREEIKDCVYWFFPMKGMPVDVGKRQSAFAVLKGTSPPQYMRCMYGSNGFYSMNNANYSIATNMVHYWQFMRGRYGRIRWGGMGSEFATNFASIHRSDGVTPCGLFFPDDPGAMSSVTQPLTLGVVPLAYGSVRFLDKTRFVGSCWLTNGTVSGRLITTDGETTSGIAYRVSLPMLANRKFLVAFLAPDDGVVKPDKDVAADAPFPVHEWANYSIGANQSNWLGKTCISYIQLSTNLLTEAYFNPSNLIANPPYDVSLIISNQLWVRIGGKGKYYLASSIKHFSEEAPLRQRSVASAEQWMTSLPNAQAKAKADNKLVLMDFTGSDWCPSCEMLDAEVFSQPEFIAYAKTNFVLLEVDFPLHKEQAAELKKANKALSKQYKIEAYPTLVLIKPDGTIAWMRLGYLKGGPVPMIAELEKAKKQGW
jgi:thiol-disulfide isomerase/thioredoxin